jgi:hypothetical protein
MVHYSDIAENTQAIPGSSVCEAVLMGGHAG